MSARASRSAGLAPIVARRPLRIFLFDPLRRGAFPTHATIEVPSEVLEPGPRGARLEVIDRDVSSDTYYEPADLESRAALLNGGFAPEETDPRFHQQMVYAVASKTLEHVDRSLGRAFAFARGKRLRILPHAFRDANAYYDRELHALLFGYFTADEREPGRNLSGQTVFTCLSHDIVAHETMHAVLDRLRPYLFEATNPDCAALHEGLADAVAILQHFAYPEVLIEALRVQRGRVDVDGVLVHLAQQFGEGLGYGGPLRTALSGADRGLLTRMLEAHDRGAIFLAGVLQAYFTVYAERTRPLLRIATGGTGQLPEGDLAPDLAALLAREAAHCAQRLLTICLRAIDYLPPVDIDFGDYLRALVSADRRLFPDDAGGYCGALIDAFLARGMEPVGAFSSSIAALEWDRAPEIPPLAPGVLANLFQLELDRELARSAAAGLRGGQDGRLAKGRPSDGLRRETALARDLHAWAKRNARMLGFSRVGTAAPIAVRAMHCARMQRIDQDGQPRAELVVQLIQSKRDARTLERFGGIPLRGGCTVIFDADGAPRHAIAKPLDDALDPEAREIGHERVRRIEEFVAAGDDRDPKLAYLSRGDARFRKRVVERSKLRQIHAHRARTIAPSGGAS